MTEEQRQRRAQKARERSARWYAANKERSHQYDKQRRLDNPEYHARKNAKFRELNPDYQAIWYQKNREVHCARTRKRNKERYVPKESPSHVRNLAKAEGMRSGFERTLSHDLKAAKVSFTYETLQLPYTIDFVYNPDFILSNGVIIEAKGLLDPESKRKMLAVKKQYPELDIRFVFMKADQKIPRTKQTHGQWATKNGFVWADGKIPKEWYE